MAELSAETQAIIDRLKAEGDLLRNSGTNSIRSVKIEMAKFQDVFNTISANIAEQTNILRQQAGFAAESLEAERTREQLEELNTEKQKFEYSDDESTRRKTDEKIDSIGDKISDALSLKNIALAGAGLFIGYNLLKGFIDDQTGGGFSEMQDTIANINWSELGLSIQSASLAFSKIGEKLLEFETFLDNLPAFLLGGGMVGFGLRSAGAGLIGGALSGAGGPRAGILSRIGPGILMAAAGLTVFYGEEIEQYLTEQMGADPDVANHVVTTGQATLGAMTLLKLFGATPKGLIITAAVGTAIALGGLVVNWLDGERDRQTAVFNEEVEAARIAAETAAAEGRDLSEEERRRVVTAVAEANRRTQLAIGEAAIAEAEAVAAELQSVIGEQSVTPGEGINALQMARMFSGATTGDQRSREELMSFFTAQEQNRGRISRFFNPDSQEYLRDQLVDFGQSQIFSNLDAFSDPDSMQRALDNWENIVNQMLLGQNPQGGRGSIVEEPGARAAYMREQEARTLDALIEAQRIYNQQQLINESGMIDLQSFLERVENGGTGSPVVVINAPTTVSPTVNNVSGGKSVNQVSVRTGGGNGFGGGTSNPYGLPYAVN
jgi:hypothetical protein